MTMEIEVNALATQIGSDIASLIAAQGLLTSLNTTEKSSLVGAINEVLAGSASGALSAVNNLSDLINVTTARTNLDVRSTAQVTSEITGAIAAVTLSGLGGLDQASVDARVQLVVDTAPAALDTLNEIAAALGDDANFASTMTVALAGKVSFTTAQSRTIGEKLQACQNLGIGDPEADYLATYVAVRDA